MVLYGGKTPYILNLRHYIEVSGYHFQPPTPGKYPKCTLAKMLGGHYETEKNIVTCTWSD
jgi:hypothetical protein